MCTRHEDLTMNFNFDSAVNMTQAVLSVKEELLLSVCKAEDFQPQDGIFIDPRVTSKHIS